MASNGNIFRIYCYIHLIENIEPTKWNTLNTSKDNGHKIQIQLYWEMFMEYIDIFTWECNEVHALSSGYNAGYGGKSADIWSGGICSHELICGRYPFRGRTPRETRQGITINQMKNKILAGPDPADPDLNASRNYVDVTILVDFREYAHGMLMGKNGILHCPPVSSKVVRWKIHHSYPFVYLSIYTSICTYIYI